MDAQHTMDENRFALRNPGMMIAMQIPTNGLPCLKVVQDFATIYRVASKPTTPNLATLRNAENLHVTHTFLLVSNLDVCFLLFGKLWYLESP